MPVKLREVPTAMCCCSSSAASRVGSPWSWPVTATKFLASTTGPGPTRRVACRVSRDARAETYHLPHVISRILYTLQYRVPPLAAKPRSRRTPHARTFGPSTECTRCICAARKPTAWLHDTARCPRSIRDSVEQCAAPCRCEHQRSIRTSRVCCPALSTRATTPLQTFGVVAVRQRSVHCS